MDAAGRMKTLVWGLLALLLAALVVITVLLLPAVNAWFNGRTDPVTIATSSVEGLRKQNSLTPFSARFVAVVTSSESRLAGVLSAKKTLILPGTVRYIVDLSQLSRRDVRWDAAKQTLSVSIPDVKIEGPEIDLAAMREFRDGELLLAFTDAEARLDLANRDAAVAQILKQAQEDAPVEMARAAAVEAMRGNFALPLRAAGIDAKIAISFQE